MSHDLRLVPAALAAWGGAAWLVTAGSATAVVVAVLAVLAAGLASRRPAPAVLVLVVASVCLAAVAASCAWRLTTIEGSPLSRMADDRVQATLEVEVRRDAVSFQQHGRESVVVDVVVRRVVTGRADVTMRERATAFVDGGPDGLVVGRSLVVTGRLGPSDASDEAAVIDVSRRGPVDGAAWWWEASEHVRDGVRRAVEPAGKQERALVPALVDGDDAGLSEEVEEDFRRAGLTHLTAVSGTNLTIVLAAVLVIGRAVGVRHRGLWVLGALSIVAFVLLARPDPSVVRAAAMGAVGLAAVGYGTRGGTRALAVAVIGLVFLDPWLARSAGFVLSVCATAGILLLAPALARPLMRWMPRWCALSIAVPMAAQLACTPALAAISGEVSLIAVVANLLAGPAVAPATVAGLGGGLLALVWEPAGQVLGLFAGACASWILAVGRHAASLDGAALGWQAPWQLLLVVVPVLTLVLLRVAARPVLFMGLALGLLLGTWRPPAPGWPPDGWIMVACDVGQGDASVLSAGDGSAVVVDAGPDPAAVDRCLGRLGVDRIRLMVFTHAHADHVDGWPGVRGGRSVDQVAVGPSGGPATGDVPQVRVATGQVVDVGDVSLRVVWPDAAARGTADADEVEGSATNDASIVLMATVRGVRVLLTGDIEPGAQDRLVRQGADLRAAVLKMPHHGSAQQSEAFFDAVGARVATVSSGRDNDYGHPAAAALDLLRGRGVAWWRTDLDGDVAVVLRDDGLRVVTP